MLYLFIYTYLFIVLLLPSSVLFTEKLDLKPSFARKLFSLVLSILLSFLSVAIVVNESGRNKSAN